MRAHVLLLASLACTGYGRIAETSRLEVFVMDDSTQQEVTQQMEKRMQLWAAAGSSINLCKRQTANPSEVLAKLLLAFNPVGKAAVSMRARRVNMSPRMSVGLYYSTSTGNTETVAEYIAGAAGIEDYKDIGDAEDGEVEGHDAIIVGAPTWHTGADSERSGTSWDEWLYDKLPNMDLSGKKVAIFGVGDSASYGENYCDAAGEIYEQFTARGAKVFGMTPSDEGYDYTESKSVVDDKFVGRMFDEDNYSDESEERAQAWVEQLKGEGFM